MNEPDLYPAWRRRGDGVLVWRHPLSPKLEGHAEWLGFVAGTDPVTIDLLKEAAKALDSTGVAGEAMQGDLRELLEALGIPTHARDNSPHEVMQREIIPEIRDRRTRARFLVLDIEHYLSEPDRVPVVAQRLLGRALAELRP